LLAFDGAAGARITVSIPGATNTVARLVCPRL
jgi:hypothetical protein